MKTHLKRTIWIHLCITFIFNWGGYNLFEAFELFNDKDIAFWKTIFLTFPLIFCVVISLFALMFWLLGTVEDKDSRIWNPFIMIGIIFLTFYGLTWLFDHFALIPISYEFAGEWYSPRAWLRNLFGILVAYFKAYQPINFIQAFGTSIYWFFVFWSWLTPTQELES